MKKETTIHRFQSIVGICSLAESILTNVTSTVRCYYVPMGDAFETLSAMLHMGAIWSFEM